ncbi:S1C family serine protease [Streptomyces sp. NPDC058045]|uniref:S1C family serine protease n=1 Tax=Streptomyces sp. NPDC058045 TaxID=3346311 RepID=UPI0036EBD6FB
MSTENEGNAVPPAPPAPPAPVDAPTPPPTTSTSDTEPAERAEPAGQGDGHPSSPSDQGASAAPGTPGAPASAEGETRQMPVGGGDTHQAPAPPYGAPPQPGQAPGGHPQQGGPVGDWPPPPPPVPAYSQGAGGSWGASYQQPQKSGGRGGLLAAVLMAALVAGGVGGGIGYWAAERGDRTTGSTTVSADTPQSVKRAAGSVAGIAAAALPSVVTIEAEGGNGEGGTGTGFVYDKQGHILTNNHVVASAADGGRLSATFADGKKYAAEVVGHAQGYDVAVIKLKNAPSNLRPLALANSDKVAVGDSTIAIGAPFGLSNTVTTGIVSAKNRPVATSDGAESKTSYMSALQTDASINPGNSGGPLLDEHGAVIGINSAIQSTGGGGVGGSSQSGSIGLGFAIPVNQATNVAKQLIRTGQPVYPVIGASVSLQEQDSGATITQEGASGTAPVTRGGPADKAGLKPGDTITKLDDRVIDSGPTLIGEIWTHKPGDTVKITYKRDGKERTSDVVLGQRKGDE